MDADLKTALETIAKNISLNYVIITAVFRYISKSPAVLLNQRPSGFQSHCCKNSQPRAVPSTTLATTCSA
jgi:hypothetical protein